MMKNEKSATVKASIMGVLNVTPDSFSDGGKFVDVDAAVDRAMTMLDEGADIIDVGGESTRPGADVVDEKEELRRVVPVITALASRCVVSIDTVKPAVARAATDAGARIINDVSGSLWRIAAEQQAGWIAMHMQGDPRTMQLAPAYDDVVAEVRDYLVDRAERAYAAGVSDVWIDPGIGFGKTDEQNLRLLRETTTFRDTGIPVVIGVSRKSFIGRILDISDPGSRLSGSLAATAVAVLGGATIVRTHDVKPTIEAVRLVEAIAGRV
jgi:dihydropteroate synthase